MPTPSPAHGAPRARVDPVRSEADALAIIELARSWPPRDEIIAFLLDDDHRGTGTVVDLTEVRSPADVLLVVELLGESAACHNAAGSINASSMVVASVRARESAPAGPWEDDLVDDDRWDDDSSDHDSSDHDLWDDELWDGDLWDEASDLADSFGLTLLEWFVISPDGIECPRELTGEPDRWPR